jgi:dCTP diphosphatase
MTNQDQGLYAVLSQLRLQLAQEANLPAYTVFNNRTLTELAEVRPATKEIFLEIHGVGAAKWERYGQLFLDTIIHYCAENGIEHGTIETKRKAALNSGELAPLLEKMLDFYRKRNWEPFHSPKNLAMALASEVGELVHCFRWLTEAQSYDLDPKILEEVRGEIADVFQLLVHLSCTLGIDPIEATHKKLAKLERKYPLHFGE